MSEIIKIFSLNVRGLSDITSPKYQSINNYIYSLKPDILILTETIFTHNYPFKNFQRIFSHDQEKRKGLAIIITNPNFKITYTNPVIEGRKINISIDNGREIWNITALYMPHSNKQNKYQNILKSEPGFHPDIVIGDLNVASSTKDNPKFKITSQSKALATFQSNYKLKDIAIKFKNYTPTFLSYQAATRIDKCLLKNPLYKLTSDYQVGITPTLYDHNFIMITIGKKIKREATWKINNVILLNPQTQKELAEFTANKIQNDYQRFNTRPDKRWKKLKKSITNFLQTKQKEHTTQLEEVKKQIKINEKSLHLTRQQLMEKKTILKEYNIQLNQILSVKYFKEICYKRVELPTKSLTNFLKRTNQMHKSNEKIEIEKLLNFYKKLYQKKKEKINTTILDKMFRNWNESISDQENLSLSTPITEEEIRSNMNKHNKYSTPGKDGLTYGVYQLLGNSILKPLSDLFNYWFQGGKMAHIFSTATIVSLYKKGDPADPGNWRPISLLNTDYKIYTSIINERTKKIIPRIINNNQTGFVKGRFIIDNVVLLHEAITQKDPELITLFLDIKKAFDSLDHKSIIHILKKLKFSHTYIIAINNIYKNGTASVSQNGQLSTSFPIEVGVRQGDPLSPTLFVLAMELLARTLDKKLQGIQTGSTNYKYGMFADDTIILCKGIEDKNKAIKIIKQFQTATGLEINPSKCAYLSTQLTIPEYNKIEQEKILGYLINDNGIINNYQKAIEQIIAITGKWSPVIQDIRQRAMIWKVYCLSKLWYSAWIISPSPQETQTLQNLQNWFIYKHADQFDPNKKYRAKMNETRASQSSHLGGLNTIDINHKLISFNISLVERALKLNGKSQEVLLGDSIAFQEHQKQWNLIQPLIPLNKNNNTIQPIPAKIIYQILHPRPIWKHTTDQVEINKKMNGNLNRVWIILPRIRSPHKHKYLIWRYYNNLIPFLHTNTCHICKLVRYSKKHIFFECQGTQITPPKLQHINQILTQHESTNITKWDETTLHNIFIKRKDKIPEKDKKKTNAILCIMYSIWLHFCRTLHETSYSTPIDKLIIHKLNKELEMIAASNTHNSHTIPKLNPKENKKKDNSPPNGPTTINLPDPLKISTISNGKYSGFSYRKPQHPKKELLKAKPQVPHPYKKWKRAVDWEPEDSQDTDPPIYKSDEDSDEELPITNSNTIIYHKPPPKLSLKPLEVRLHPGMNIRVATLPPIRINPKNPSPIPIIELHINISLLKNNKTIPHTLQDPAGNLILPPFFCLLENDTLDLFDPHPGIPQNQTKKNNKEKIKRWLRIKNNAERLGGYAFKWISKHTIQHHSKMTSQT